LNSLQHALFEVLTDDARALFSASLVEKRHLPSARIIRPTKAPSQVAISQPLPSLCPRHRQTLMMPLFQRARMLHGCMLPPLLSFCSGVDWQGRGRRASSARGTAGRH